MPEIKVIPYESLGCADHGWLKAKHHFSFASYYDPARTGFGSLLVVNDDRIAAKTGFPPHPHDNMEIITYVRSGAISHADSMGNRGRTPAGDVQVMSAGSGIRHSEMNAEDEATTLYQIWIRPNEASVKPRWDQKAFPKAPVTDALPRLVSGRAEDEATGALFIHADAAISGGRLAAGTSIRHHLKHGAYILVSEGVFTVDGVTVRQGDGAEVRAAASIEIAATTDGEILVIDVPGA